MNKRITSTQIAELAGVSRATVSFVLNGHAKRERISAKTVDRVLRIVSEKNYRTNGAARAMRRNRFDCLSLLMGGGKGGWLPFGLLRNLQRETEAQGMHLNVSELSETKFLTHEFAPKILREFFADGLLVNYLHDDNNRLEQMLDEYAIPHMWINDIRSHDCVYPDDFNGCIKAVKMLVDMGHRHIAYLSINNSLHYSHEKREQGFLHATSAEGIKAFSLHVDPNPDIGAFRDRIEKMLRGKNRPTACIGYSASELQITFAVALRMGLRVPQDLSLLTFDTHHPLLGDLKQSTLVLPQNEMAKVAVKLLVQKIEQPTQNLDPVGIEYLDDTAGETIVPPSTSG